MGETVDEKGGGVNVKRRTPEVQTVRPWTPAELAAATVHSPSSLTAMSTVICPEEVRDKDAPKRMEMKRSHSGTAGEGTVGAVQMGVS